MSNPKLLRYSDKAQQDSLIRLLAIRQSLTDLMLALEEEGMEESIFYLTQVEGELRGRLGEPAELAAFSSLIEGLH